MRFLASANRGDGRVEPLQLGVEPIFQLTGAAIGVERLDLLIDGGDAAVHVERGDPTLDRTDLAVEVEGADLRLDRGDLAVDVERGDLLFHGRNARVGAVVADLPLDARDRGIVLRDAGRDAGAVAG